VLFAAAFMSFIIAGCCEDCKNNGISPTTSIIGYWDLTKRVKTYGETGQIITETPEEIGYKFFIITFDNDNKYFYDIKGFDSDLVVRRGSKYDPVKQIIHKFYGVEGQYEITGGRLFIKYELVHPDDGLINYEMEFIKRKS